MCIEGYLSVDTIAPSTPLSFVTRMYVLNDIISPDGLLDESVCAGVHVGRGLVQHQHPVLAQDGPGQAHQLPTNEGTVLDCVDQ